MHIDALQLAIIGPALIAGLLVTATHVPLGMQVLQRGIVFIDLAVAQIAGLGVIFADWMGFEPAGWSVQFSAFGAAIAGALLLTWTEKRWPQVQEAIIGVAFVLASTGAILLLANNPHAGEQLRDLLVGQILFADAARLGLTALVYAVLLALWFIGRERIGRVGFYVLFACVVTLSVQLVGLFLVFTTLIVPALATHQMRARRLLLAYLIGLSGYVLGLALAAVFDLPAGATCVWAMSLVAAAAFAINARIVASK